MKNQIAIISFLESNPKSDAKKIEIGTSIPRSEVLKTLKGLEGKITVFQKGSKSVKLFSAVVAEPIAKAKAKKAKKVVRDLSKYKFGKEKSNKGKIALSIVKSITDAKKISLEKLLEIFPKSVNSYGVFIKPVEAAELANSRGRKLFFTAKEDLIKLRGGVVVAVTNQIGVKNIDAIIKIGKENGCSVKAL